MALLTTGTPSGPWRSSVHSRVSTCRVLLQHHKRSNKHAPSAEMGSACSEGFPVHTTRPLGHCGQLLQLRQQLQFYHRAQKVPAGVQVVRYNCHPRPISAARMQMELVCSECFPCRTTRAFRRVLDCCSSGSSSTPSAYLRAFNASQASSHPRPISSARRQPPVAAAVPATLHNWVIFKGDTKHMQLYYMAVPLPTHACLTPGPSRQPGCSLLLQLMQPRSSSSSSCSCHSAPHNAGVPHGSSKIATQIPSHPSPISSARMQQPDAARAAAAAATPHQTV